MSSVSFPFVVMTGSNVVGGVSAPDFIATKDKMFAIFESWEKEAARLVATNNDPFGNAATFLTSGNFDVIGSHIEAWRPAHLFVYIDEDAEKVLGFVLIQDTLIVADTHKYVAILAAAVSPFCYNKGVGKHMIEIWIQYEKTCGDVDGIILQAEPTAMEFWKKVGFTKWETTIESACPELTKMIFPFF